MYHKESKTHVGRVSKSKISHIFFQLYRDMIDIHHCVSLGCNLLINVFLYCNMAMTITITALANTRIMSPSYCFPL